MPDSRADSRKPRVFRHSQCAVRIALQSSNKEGLHTITELVSATWIVRDISPEAKSKGALTIPSNAGGMSLLFLETNRLTPTVRQGF